MQNSYLAVRSCITMDNLTFDWRVGFGNPFFPLFPKQKIFFVAALYQAVLVIFSRAPDQMHKIKKALKINNVHSFLKLFIGPPYAIASL